MNEFDIKNIKPNQIIVFKKNVIKKIRQSLFSFKKELESNKELFEKIIKEEVNKNTELKNLLTEIKQNFLMILDDYEYQLLYIDKINNENKLLKNKNNHSNENQKKLNEVLKILSFERTYIIPSLIILSILQLLFIIFFK